MDIVEQFEKWTIGKVTKHGYSLRCKKGLWGVDATTMEEAEREAMRYFMLYLADGEYK